MTYSECVFIKCDGKIQSNTGCIHKYKHEISCVWLYFTCIFYDFI